MPTLRSYVPGSTKPITPSRATRRQAPGSAIAPPCQANSQLRAAYRINIRAGNIRHSARADGCRLKGWVYPPCEVAHPIFGVGSVHSGTRVTAPQVLHG